MNAFNNEKSPKRYMDLNEEIDKLSMIEPNASSGGDAK